MRRYRVIIDQTVRAAFYIDGDSAEEVRARVEAGDWGIDDPQADGYNQLSDEVIKFGRPKVRRVSKTA